MKALTHVDLPRKRPQIATTARGTSLIAAAAGALALGSAHLCAASQLSYEIVATFGLPVCGDVTSQYLLSQSINNSLEVVGYFAPCAIGTFRPFYWSPGTGLVIIPITADFDDTRLLDINEAGVASGARALESSGLGWEAVLYKDGVWTGLGMLPGATESWGLAIDEFGTVAGSSQNTVTGPLHAMSADVDGMTDLGPLIPGLASWANGLNDAGAVVGFTASGGFATRQGFILQGRQVTLVPAFPGTENTELVGINNVGDAVAQSRVVAAQASVLGFVRRNGVWSQIPVPAPYTRFRPFRINALGMVTGQVNVPPNPGTAAIFVNGETYLLKDIVLKGEGHLFNEAWGINDDGWLVCSGAKLGSPLPTLMNFVLRPIPGVVGDLNFDGQVNAVDLAVLLGAFGTTRLGPDLNNDGLVEAADIAILLGNWTGT